MNPALTDYIKQKRESKVDDGKIRQNLIEQGWPTADVEKAMGISHDNDAPPPPPLVPSQVSVSSQNPTPVVNTFTTRGIEYLIMFISLWVTATSIGFLLHQLVDSALGGGSGDDFYGFIEPVTSASLVVALPIFAILFLRLKKAEQNDPSVRQDHSRRRAINITLVVTFLIGIFKVIGTVYQLISGGGDSTFYDSVSTYNPLTEIMHLIITLGIAGGIFAYYWHDLHQSENE